MTRYVEQTCSMLKEINKELDGGDDGARTRDLRRDRPAF